MFWKTLAVFVIPLLLGGCTPKAIVVTPIAPAASIAHGLAKASGVSAKRVTEATVLATAASIGLGFQVSQALAEADRQRNDRTIPPDIAALNFETLSRLAALAFEAERSSRKATIEASQHEEDVASVETATGEVAKAAVVVDKTAIAQTKLISKMEGDAAMGKAVKWVFVGGSVLIVGFIFIKLFKPF